MTKDDIIRTARELGIDVLIASYGAFPQLKRFADLVAEAEREEMRTQGWRQCAVGQKTTQYCSATNYAVWAEREACIEILENNAKVCEPGSTLQACLTANAAAIRARNQHDC